MAPPSLAEFIQTLIVRESVASMCSRLRGSVHLGTRGCLCDFTQNLSEARLKVLSGFICYSCRKTLDDEGFSAVAEILPTILSRNWVGALDNPSSISSRLKKLKLDLFHTSGLESNFSETTSQLLKEQVVREAIKLAGVVIGAALLIYLGLKTGGEH